ncbi:MAG: response regulator [Candidatus Sedimenticola endophacoides]|uniref:Response regulator n=1 Tax=Candidatus Sedimenticola endophacoides TaxID=2548426 RepID=A0A6N4DW63_9GAMM|nr:MAG: response regulator [Candidatus Sedimenticola endophacoides]PUE01046.1 MAG: response regulator [Candidatus Sedimenticola endophacoides]PUE03620.1 MAG: response regulator [Candidatus Sedimenticola endophacoides]
MKGFFKKGDGAGAGVSGGAVDGGGATVLIVDDSPTETFVIKKIVEGAGFTTATAENGESGVAEAKRIKPDVILMDVVMPGLNGFQATRQLSKDPETMGIPVIMVTTKDQETDRAWGLRQGAKEYVVKPIVPAELISKIGAVLNG